LQFPKNLNKLPEVVKIKINVEREKFRSRNLLAGNLTAPKTIFFTHYDTVLKGTIDNASVAVLLYFLINHKSALKENLFVFGGSEELSFEEPYWSKGYRELEKEYVGLMESMESSVDGWIFR